MLVSATYQTGAWVVLGFDRAVEIGGIVPAEVSVLDGPQGFVYGGVGAELVGPAAVRVTLAEVTDDGGPAVILNAGATGIVSAADGTPWAGAEGVVLPFP